MSKFKDRLWRELVREHGQRLEHTPPPSAKSARRAGPRVLAGTTAGLAAAAAVLAVALSATSSTPAFAVTRNDDGSITVNILRASGIAGANERLQALGVPAKAMTAPVPAACVKPSQLHARLASLPPPTFLVVRARIDPRLIPANHVAVIEAWKDGGRVRVVPQRLLFHVALACGPLVPPSCAIAQRVLTGSRRPTGNSGPAGNSGPPPAGNSGNSGIAPGKGCKTAAEYLRLRATAHTVVSKNSSTAGNS